MPTGNAPLERSTEQWGPIDMTSDASGPLHWQIGDVRVTRIVELPSTRLRGLLPDAKPEVLTEIDWMRPFVDDQGRLELSIHCLVVETRDRLIVVDTCIGNDKPRTFKYWNGLQTDFLARFCDAGFELERVDRVLCTHMHVDHVGWNTRLAEGRWVPTFPNARYLYAEREWAHWRHEPQDMGPIVEDSVQPIFDAGLADVVASDHRVCDEVRLFSTPGHTPGHVSVWIESKGMNAVITGDMIHHPCQLPFPEWASVADSDSIQSTGTRRDFYERVGDRPVLVIGTHFKDPTAGHIVREGNGFRLAY